jgi:uncharacterized membrane protein YeaQ/YmgE (transglycosylase-associated protein family)
LIGYLILLVIMGLFIGALGRLALPGPDPMSIPQTILIGIAASFVAGLISMAIFDRNAGSILISAAVATGIVYLVRRSRGGSLDRPANAPGLARGRRRGF